MQLIGLRFLLEGSQFLNVVVPVNEAQSMINGWASGEYKRQGQKTLGGQLAPGQGGWALQIDHIKGMHTFDLEPAPQGPVPPPVPPTQNFPTRPGWVTPGLVQNRSGL